MNEVFEKVLYIGPQKEFGGIGSVLEVYSKNIKNFNFIPTYPSPSSLNSGFKFKIYRITFFLKSVLLISKTLMFRKQIKILHIHSAANGSFFRKSVICFLGKIFRKKVIFHIHSGNFPTFYDKSGILKRYIKQTLKISDAVICLSKQWEDYYSNDLKLANTTIISNPVEIDQNEKVKKNTDGVIQLLFLGKVCDAKGVFDLIHFLESNKYFLNNKIKLTIAGNGEVDRLKPFLCQHIEFIGWVTDELKKKAISDCDIYILPSYFEGLPISILEAMASSKPIIATNVGGIPSIVSNKFNGWLIQPVSAKELEKVFEDIFNDMNILKIYGANSLKEAQKYRPEVIMEDLSKLYNALLTGG